MNKAVFYDRDGIIVKMVYNLEFGTIDTPRNPSEISFIPEIFDLLKYTTSLSYKNIIISNQPVIANKKISKEGFEAIRNEMFEKLKEQNAVIDGDYYCFHHPNALVSEYKKSCKCRKPQPGLLFKAAKENKIDLSKSWIIGDGVNDVLAGHSAGCRTILLANLYESEYLRVLEKNLGGVKPDFLIKNLKEAIEIINI
jgi:D,D-heptose 1,7-bisphosphate phosphatase